MHSAQGPTPESDSPQAPAPDLLESLRQVGAAGQASASATLEAAKAMRALVVADIALARSALGRSVALIAVAIVLGAVGGLLLTASLVTLLAVHFQIPWTYSLLLVGLLCLVGTALAGWRASVYFDHTRLKATRRQLARIGIGEMPEKPAANAAAATVPPAEAPQSPAS